MIERKLLAEKLATDIWEARQAGSLVLPQKSGSFLKLIKSDIWSEGQQSFYDLRYLLYAPRYLTL